MVVIFLVLFAYALHLLLLRPKSWLSSLYLLPTLFVLNIFTFPILLELVPPLTPYLGYKALSLGSEDLNIYYQYCFICLLSILIGQVLARYLLPRLAYPNINLIAKSSLNLRFNSLHRLSLFGLYSALTVCQLLLFLRGYTSKSEIVADSLSSIVKQLFYIATVLFGIFLASATPRQLFSWSRFPNLYIHLIICILLPLVLLGERDVAASSSLLFLCYSERLFPRLFKLTLYSLISLPFILVSSAGLLSSLKSIILSRNFSFSLDAASLLVDEFIAFGRNSLLILSRQGKAFLEYYSYPSFQTSIERSFLPSFLRSQTELTPSHWFNNSYTNDISIRSATRWGYSLMADSLLSLSVVGLILTFVLLAFIVYFFEYCSLLGSCLFFSLYPLIIVSALWVFRSDMSGFFSQIIKIPFIAASFALLLGRLRSR